MSNEMPKYILAEQDYINGMKYKDIADKYNVSINTVKSWKTRYEWIKEKGAPKSKRVRTQKENKSATKKEAIAEAVESVINNPDLTDKQRLFCLCYSRTFNATTSYQKAYNVDYLTANAHGYKLLSKAVIKEEILRLKKERISREFISEADIFEKYMQIAFADITDYVTFDSATVSKEDHNGNEYEAVINNVSIKSSNEVDGTLITEVSQGREGVKVKLPDRMKALDWLASHMDMATEEQRAKIDHLKAQTAKVSEDESKGESVVIVDDIPDEG